MSTRLDRDRSTARLLGQIVAAAAEARAYLEDADASERGLAWSAPDARQHAECVMFELGLLVARLDGVYGSAPVRVVAADAVADSPTDAEIDEVVTHAIAWEPAPGDEDIMPLARHLTLWGEFRVSGGGAA